jgi:hypothetical protein
VYTGSIPVGASPADDLTMGHRMRTAVAAVLLLGGGGAAIVLQIGHDSRATAQRAQPAEERAVDDAVAALQGIDRRDLDRMLRDGSLRDAVSRPPGDR